MRIQLIAVVLVATLIPACGKRQASSPALSASHGYGSVREWHGPPRQLKKSELTEAEQKYGIAPVPDSTVTYQPEVVIVGGGAAAIRSQDPEGIRWTIDANAPHANELKFGKVFFMTDRAVGRVLDVRRDGDDLIVLVGPVEITEIFLKATIDIKDMPIDFNEAIAHTLPALPGQIASVTPPPPRADSGWGLYKVQASTPAAPPVAVPDVTKALEKNFKIMPTVSTEGIGVHVSADSGGLSVSAETLVGLSAPKLDVKLVIDRGISQATIELKGAAGLTWNFSVGTDVGMKANVNAVLSPDTDFSIPVGGIGGAPFSVTVRQKFLIQTGLGVRNTILSATGVYTFKGGFRIGYENGGWGIAGPVGFTSKTSMTQTGTGISLAAAGLNLSNQIKVIAGVGTQGFVAGPYFSFTTAVGALRNSDIGMLACTMAVLDIKLGGGVGYLIPKAVTNLINSVLRALNISFVVKGEGGLDAGTETLLSKSSQLGGCKPPDKDGSKGSLAGPV